MRAAIGLMPAAKRIRAAVSKMMRGSSGVQVSLSIDNAWRAALATDAAWSGGHGVRLEATTVSGLYAAANGCLTWFRFATTSAAFGSPLMARAIDSFTAR